VQINRILVPGGKTGGEKTPMRALLRFANAIDQLSEWLGGLSSNLVLVLVAVGFYNVLARFLGRFVGQNLSSNLWIELQWYLFSLIFFFSFGFILKNGVNVRVDFLYTNWSVKRKAWVDLLGTLIFLIPFCIMGIYVSIFPVMQSWGRLPDGSFGTWEMSPDPGGLPRAPIKTMIIVAFVLLLLQAIAQVIKYLAIVRGQEQIFEQIQAEAGAHGPIG
jgi:TRAP-type mannitol/chloroaromatic compound transport system permease small subunit